MKRTMMSWMLVASVFATTAAACGSDDAKPTAPTAAPAADGESGTSAEVTDYCTKATELGQQLKNAMADPASADAAGITAKAAELSTSAAALIAANPNDSAKINECLVKLNPTG